MDEKNSEQLSKLEEYAKLQEELDRKFGSLSLSQLFVLIVVFVFLVVFLGLLGELFLGSVFGTIIASVLTSLALIGASNGVKSSNIRRFLQDRQEDREESQDNEVSG